MCPSGGRADVLVVSLGSTGGLRTADDELVASLRRAGARVAMVRPGRPREVRTLALTDLGWSLAARDAAREGIARARPHAVVYSTSTAALLAPRTGAIRFDAPSSGNRPGRHGVWQRPLERRRLTCADLLVPWSAGALEETPRPQADAVVVPVPVEPSGPTGRVRDIAAITYGSNPRKKGLDRVLVAWAAARPPGGRLVVAGITEAEARRALGARVTAIAGVTFAGRLAPREYRELLRRSRVFVIGARREDYGIAQLEALVDGCRLVTTPAPGPYAALALARALDERLVGDDLAAGLRVALTDSAPDYADRARELTKPWRREAADRVVAEQLLPRLLGSPGRG
jgi:hypothetical protein